MNKVNALQSIFENWKNKKGLLLKAIGRVLAPISMHLEISQQHWAIIIQWFYYCGFTCG